MKKLKGKLGVGFAVLHRGRLTVGIEASDFLAYAKAGSHNLYICLFHNRMPETSPRL